MYLNVDLREENQQSLVILRNIFENDHDVEKSS